MKNKVYEQVGANNDIWVTELHPLHGEIDRPARRIETLIFKAKDFLHQVIENLGENTQY